MMTLVDRFRNATVAGFKDRALNKHCASLSRQRKATERSENASPADHTLPRLPEVYRTHSAVVVLSKILQHSSVY